jgi:CMP-N-acetylneuraminic acid synthetase
MIYIILARRGSTRCRDKNVKPFFDGKNLVEVCVSKLGPEDKVVINTDYPKDYLSKEWNGNMVYMERDPFLCGPETTSEEVVQSVMNSYLYEDFCLLQATTPMLDKRKLKVAREIFEEMKYDSLVAVNPAIQPCGAFYFCKRDRFYRYGTWWTPNMGLYVLDWTEAFDINEEYEFRIAQTMYKEMMKHEPPV